MQKKVSDLTFMETGIDIFFLQLRQNFIFHFFFFIADVAPSNIWMMSVMSFELLLDEVEYTNDSYVSHTFISNDEVCVLYNAYKANQEENRTLHKPIFSQTFGN